MNVVESDIQLRDFRARPHFRDLAPFRSSPRRRTAAHQNGDDEDHHQQLDQRESRRCSIREWFRIIGVSFVFRRAGRVSPPSVARGAFTPPRSPAGYLLKPSSSLISGRNSAMTMEPMMKPRTTIMIGSSRLIRLSTSTSTSSS